MIDFLPENILRHSVWFILCFQGTGLHIFQMLREDWSKCVSFRCWKLLGDLFQARAGSVRSMVLLGNIFCLISGVCCVLMRQTILIIIYYGPREAHQGECREQNVWNNNARDENSHHRLAYGHNVIGWLLRRELITNMAFNEVFRLAGTTYSQLWSYREALEHLASRLSALLWSKTSGMTLLGWDTSHVPTTWPSVSFVKIFLLDLWTFGFHTSSHSTLYFLVVVFVLQKISERGIFLIAPAELMKRHMFSFQRGTLCHWRRRWA